MGFLDALVDIHGDLEVDLFREIVLPLSLAKKLDLLERVGKLDSLRRRKRRPGLPKKIFLKFQVKSFRRRLIGFS